MQPFAPQRSAAPSAWNYCRQHSIGTKTNDHSTIHQDSRRGARGWAPTRVAPFSGLYDDADPFVTRDGKRLFFLSKRPVGENSAAKPDLDIWVMEREGNAWGAPKHLGARVNGPADEHYVTVADDGTLYIAGIRPDSRNRGDRYRIKPIGNEYGDPENLGAINGPDHDTTPFVAPDQSYIIFASRGRADAAGRALDLYISFRDGAGWTEPKNLGPTINSVADDYCPLVSPDGETLYFSSERNFSDEQTRRISSWSELRDKLASPGNSLGDVYTVKMSVVRKVVGR